MESAELAHQIAKIALEKKGEDIAIYEVGTRSSVADFFVLVTARSERQVRALAETVSTSLKKQGMAPLGIEGAGGSQWVLVDFGGVVAHVFHEDARFFYDLDGLWHDVPKTVVDDRNPARAVGV